MACALAQSLRKRSPPLACPRSTAVVLQAARAALVTPAQGAVTATHRAAAFAARACRPVGHRPAPGRCLARAAMARAPPALAPGSPAAALVQALRTGLAEQADPAKAPAMQAYMKSAMPFHGVSAPAREKLFKAAFGAHALPSAREWRDAALALWRGAGVREERYAALSLLGHAAYAAFAADVEATLPLLAEVVDTGAWWDYVDTVAPRHLGAWLRQQPAAARPLVLDWAQCDGMWRRRAAIIAQLGAKEHADAALLYECVRLNWEGTRFGDEFFVRKAIGWALRARARHAPAEVRAFVAAHAAQLAPLSRREALKRIGPGDDGGGAYTEAGGRGVKRRRAARAS